jgi:hypothetical protein
MQDLILFRVWFRHISLYYSQTLCQSREGNTGFTGNTRISLKCLPCMLVTLESGLTKYLVPVIIGRLFGYAVVSNILVD